MTFSELDQRHDAIVELRGDEITEFCDLLAKMAIFDPMQKRITYWPVPQCVRFASVIRGVRDPENGGRHWYFEPTTTRFGVPIP